MTIAKTPLDQAHAAMADGTEASIRAYYAQLLSAELFMPLTGDQPAEIAMDTGRFALAFDHEERLAEFADGPIERAVISGRQAIAMAVAADQGIGINLGVSDTAYLLPAPVVAWIAENLASPLAEQAGISEFCPPKADSDVIAAIDAALSGLSDRADRAILISAPKDLLLLIAGAEGADHPGIAAHLAESLHLRLADQAPAVSFTDDGSVLARADRVGIGFDIPKAKIRVVAAPGSDPAKPPRLR